MVPPNSPLAYSGGMATGNAKGRIGSNDTLMSGAMLKQAVRDILKRVRLDRKHDVPYLAGYSRDNKTIYIDRHLPKTFVTRRKRVAIDDFLILHEAVEQALIDHVGLTYQHAHQIALRVEQAAVRAADISWHDYNQFMQEHIKEAEDDFEKLPADLDIKPYRDEHDTESLQRMQKAKRRKG